MILELDTKNHIQENEMLVIESSPDNTTFLSRFIDEQGSRKLCMHARGS